MCGIFFSNFPLKKNAKNLVLDWLKKRGPDGFEEYYINEKTFIHSRLAIVGEASSEQPIVSKKTVLVCNGEIYNYRQLIRDFNLVVKGSSDCEVIQKIYEKNQALDINLFDGMYAGILYDLSNDALFCFRDFAGEKPLYYFRDGNRLAIASEWPILANLFDIGTFNDNAIQEYYFKQFVSENPIFRGLEIIKPGTVLKFDFLSSKMKFISSRDPGLSQKKISKKEFCDGFRQKVFKGITDCINHGDYLPVVSLSSGLDSNLIVSAAKHLNLDFDICTIGFRQYSSYDESIIAKNLTRNFYKKKIQRFIFKNNYTKLDLKKAIGNRCDLIGDGSVFIIDELLKNISKKKYKVYVSGIGGDELFSDYPWAQRFKGLNSFGDMNLLKQVLKRFTYRKTLPSDFWQARPYYKQLLKSKLFDSDAYNFSNLCPIKQVKNELNYYLIANGLAQTDRLSLRYGVEARSPLVSKNLRRFVDQYYFDGMDNIVDLKKTIYMASFADIMPNHIFNYRKQGFRAPIEKLSSLMVELYKEEMVGSENDVLSVHEFSKLEASIKRVYLNILVVSNQLGISFKN